MNPPKMQMLQTAPALASAALAAATVLGLALSSTAHAQSPGLEALEAFKAGQAEQPAVENRFFKKQSRLEISPMFGYVPNNPFARRFVGSGSLGYHFNETWSAHVQVQYSPDLAENDLKDLTAILLDRANTGEAGAEFRQPLDKVTLGAVVGVAWAPVYGKINLVGETVLNFDFYLFGGVGMVSKNEYAATYEVDETNPNDFVNLGTAVPEVEVGPYIGIGQNYFLSQSIAIKIDLRTAFYIDDAPRYTEDFDPDVRQPQRLYNNLVAGAGFAFFFPKMKPRIYNF